MTARAIKHTGLFIVVWLTMLMPFADAWSADAIIPYEPADVCTDGPQFKTDIPEGQTGVFSKVRQSVLSLTSSLGESMFNSIQGNGGFQEAVSAAIILYIAIYGILFMTGNIRANAYDFTVRLIKVSVVALLVQPAAWNFFNTFIYDFFNTATDEFMAQVANIAVGSGQKISGDDAFPIQIIDRAIAKVVSMNMGVHLLAMLFTPPYGFFYLVLLIIALWSFIGLLLTGIWVYLTALVFRGLLVGLAPIFLACFLFTKTKHLFDGWINQLISTCLQPILLFSFLSLFVMMVIGSPTNEGLIDKILNKPVCWTAAHESLQGSPFSAYYWRYTIEKTGDTEEGTANFEPFGGQWGFNGPIGVPGPVFPLELMPLLTFLILAELGKRFGQMVLMIARELSASSVDLSDMQNIFANLMPSSNPGGSAGGTPPPSSGSASAAFTKGMSDSISNSVRSPK
jgi:hypothetical protein